MVVCRVMTIRLRGVTAGTIRLLVPTASLVLFPRQRPHATFKPTFVTITARFAILITSKSHTRKFKIKRA